VAGYDVLIAGGTLAGSGAARDVAFSAGRVAAVEERIDPVEAETLVDAAGMLVTPGLIDVHGHFFHGCTPIPGVADELCPPCGTTTAADAGTAGPMTFPLLRDYVVPSQRTRVLAWVGIAATGYLMSRVLGTEFHDMRVLDPDATAAAIEGGRGTAIGVKLRLGVDLQTAPQAREALAKATGAARAAGVPLMVHVYRAPIPLAELLDALDPGDVVTHAFHAAPNGVLDDAGRVLTPVREAAERGIVLDAGYAGGLLCDLDVVRAALEQGIAPATLGTDAADFRVAPPNFYGLDETVNLFAALGMGRGAALRAATETAARVLGLQDEAGALRPGMAGDAAVFSVRSGRFRWHGTGGQSVEADEKLVLEATVRAGEVVWRAGAEVHTPLAETVA
jgi:dihydroorotase